MFNPHSEEWLKNKFKYYKTITDYNSLYFSEKYNSYVVTNFEDVKFCLLNSDIFSSAKGNLVVESPHRFGRTLGASDDPVHSYYKSVVKSAYSKENIDRIVTYALDSISFEGDELNASTLAKQVSARLTVELLGLPADKEEVYDLVLGIQQYSPKTVLISPNQCYDDRFKNLTDILLKDKVPTNSPGIYAEMLNNSGTSVKSLLSGPTISGASSMTGALEFLILDLFRESQLDLLINDASLIPLAVNESIRFNSSTGRFSRTVTRDITIRNTQLKVNDRLIVCLDAANRDVNQFHNPDQFDITRQEQNLGFGYGPHACIALAISKALMISYLRKLLSSFGKYEVVSEGSYLLSASGNNDMIDDIIIRKVVE